MKLRPDGRPLVAVELAVVLGLVAMHQAQPPPLSVQQAAAAAVGRHHRHVASASALPIIRLMFSSTPEHSLFLFLVSRSHTIRN